MKQLKKIISVLLVVVMCLTAPLQGSVKSNWFYADFGLKASAHIVSLKGMCGDKVFYTYDNISKELVISGIGNMGDYGEYESPFYESDIKSVIIQEGVTSIGDYAFKSCSKLESVSIPKSVITIGRYSFYRCRNLKNLILPDGVSVIKEHAFDYCSNLENISMSKSITSIGAYAFEECYKLRSITIPENVVSIGECAFNHCQYLKNITIYDNVNSIGANAFNGTAYHNDVNNWIDNVIYLGKYLLKADSTISNSYKIKEGTLIIADKAFANCSSICEVIIPNSIKNIGAYAFYESTNLKEVILSEGLKTIGDGAFSGCSSLETFSIPQTVIDIGVDILKDTAWFNYKGKGLVSLDDWIFGYKGTDENSTVILSNTTKGIADGAFRSNINIVAFEVTEDNQRFSSENGVLFNKEKDILIEYPCGNEETYYDVPNTVLEIKEYAFYDCNNLRSLNISDSVKYIGNNAFYNCNNLDYINIGIGVKAIGTGAFFYTGKYSKTIHVKDLKAWCNIDFESSTSNPLYSVNLYNYALDYSCLYINEYPAEHDIVIPNTIVEIKQYAFYNCRNLKNITIPSSVQSISNCAFYNCRQLSNIVFGSGLKNIGHNAFYNCVSLENIDFPDNVETIGYKAFAYCKELNTVTLGKCLKAIGYWGFSSCSKLKEVYYPCSQTDWNLISIESGNFDGVDIFLMHKHDYTITVTKEPTCTETGNALYTCSMGETRTVALPALGHNASEQEFTVDITPTCTNTGSKSKHCTRCNFTEQSTLIPKIDHIYSLTKESTPTCTTTGTKKFTCSCGDTYTETIPATGHINLTIDNGKPATTTEVGYTAGKYCNDCKTWIDGHIEIPKLHSHSYTATITKTATCTTTGTKKLSCICGDTYTETVPATGHINLTIDNGKLATTTEVGYTAGKYCNDCKTWIEGHVEIPKLHSHSYAVTITKTATCTATGTKRFTCSCGDTYTETIPATGHINLTIDNGKPATTTEVGYTAGKYCNDCKTWIDGHIEIPKLHSHSYAVTITKTATCTATGTKRFTCSCGDTYTETIPATGHINLTIDNGKPATTTEVGYTAGKYCNDCKTWIDGHIEIPKLHSHSYTATITKTATCTTTGTKKFACSCGDTYTETIPATGHINLIIDNGKPATKTEVGYTAGKYCNDCKTWIEGHTVIPKLEDDHKHSYSSSITKEATCTEAGVKTFTCSCGDSYTESIDKIEHEYVTETWKATLTTNGGYKKLCKYCGKITGEGIYYSPEIIKLSTEKYTYDGKTKKPSVFVEDKMGVDFKEGTDYTVKYESGRKAPGKYTVTITFIGKYEGKKVLEFKILPGKTSKITATQSASAIKLTWKKVTGADGYRIYQYNSKTGKYEKIKTTTGTTYTIKKLKAGTTYKFAVKAYTKDNGETLWAASSKSIKTATEPAVPTVKITAGSKKATLKWNKVTGATGYVVYMKNSDGSYKKLGSTKSTSYTKNSLKSGKKYYFRVRAYKTVDGKNIYGGYKTYSVKVK